VCRTWPGRSSRPAEVRKDLEAIIGCIGAAAPLVLDDYLAPGWRGPGFREVHVDRHPDAARKMIEVLGDRPARPAPSHLIRR